MFLQPCPGSSLTKVLHKINNYYFKDSKISVLISFETKQLSDNVTDNTTKWFIEIVLFPGKQCNLSIS